MRELGLSTDSETDSLPDTEVTEDDAEDVPQSN